MTTVTHHTETVVREVWTAPCRYSPHGDGYVAVIGEFLQAYEMAETYAKQMGVNTRCDDWAFIQPRDEEVRIFFDTVQPVPPPF